MLDWKDNKIYSWESFDFDDLWNNKTNTVYIHIYILVLHLFVLLYLHECCPKRYPRINRDQFSIVRGKILIKVKKPINLVNKEQTNTDQFYYLMHASTHVG
jgi:hypothetical protein